MCGRFSLTLSPKIIKDYFGLDNVFEFEPRYNIAPTQDVMVVYNNPANQKQLASMRWGFIPSWMKQENISSKFINARVETAHEKPMFRHAFKHRRCLIVASSFYEWQRESNIKQPYVIQLPSQEPLAMASLWEHWHDGDGLEINSCTILTTEANASVEYIHNRMPVLLTPKSFEPWLDIDNEDTNNLLKLVSGKPLIKLASYPVSTKVNNPRFENPECLKAIYCSP